MENNLYLPSLADIRSVLKVGKKDVPSFPLVATKLLDASRDDTVPLEEFGKMIETDPGLSVRVLELTNSAMTGLQRKITSLPEAVTILGLDEIRKMALSVTVFDTFFKSGSNGNFSQILFWRHCLCVALLSLEIAKETGYSDPEEAYAGGLLHDLGKIFLDIRGKKDYGEFISAASRTTDNLIDEERRVLGLGHDDIGAYFCSRWNLPGPLNLAVKYHHQPYDRLGMSAMEKHLVAIVSLSDFLCWTQGLGSFDFIHPPVLSPEVEKNIDLEKLDIVGCLNRMHKEIESISKFYQFVFPSAVQLRENIVQASIKLSKTATRYYFKEDPMGGSGAVNPPSVSDLDLELGKPLARAKSVKTVLDIVMYQIGRIFHPRDWSVLLKDPKTGDMVFSLVVGQNKKKLQGKKLPKGEGIAGHIMKAGKPLIIKDVSRDNRFSMRVDKLTGFKTTSIVGTPLKTGEKIFGVIELVNRMDDVPFKDRDMKLLTAISEYAAIAIERSYYNQALKQLAVRDPLTGLKNRLSFDRALSDQDDLKLVFGTIFSILIINVQRPGRIEEETGFSHGGTAMDEDTVLKELARILVKNKRREDDVFRFAELTLVMVLPHTYAEGADRAKKRLLDVIPPKLLKEKSSFFSVSVHPRTLGVDDARKLKYLIAQSLSNDDPSMENLSVPNIKEELQPFLEDEEKKQTALENPVQTFGKSVALTGQFTRLENGESGQLKVERLSLTSVGCRISTSHRIRVNDFLDICFTLDDLKRSPIKRQIIVKELAGNFILGDFYNPPPYAKDLGFYLMN